MQFTLDNIPFGIFSVQGGRRKAATIIGDQVIDLYELCRAGYFDELSIDAEVFNIGVLNDFISLGKDTTNAVRTKLKAILIDVGRLPHLAKHFVNDVEMHLPIRIGDYTDFYSSEQHAFNVGSMFRDPTNALLPNWKHLPVAYHGRASSIFVSGKNFHRPKGQLCPDETKPPVFGPTKRLDIELEMATVIGRNNEIGDAVDVNVAEDYVFGFLIFNDWSARDIQKWEYVPLGPFLAKNFFSSASAWIVTLEALEDFRVAAEPQEPPVLPYLQDKKRLNFDIQLEVTLKTSGGIEMQICKSNFKYMYWTVAQQIAHHTVNGCNLNVADVLASGTISGKEKESFGSLLELTWGGKNPIILPDGSQRTFLEDGDTITIKAYAENGKQRIDFGEVVSTVLPSK